MGVRIFRPAARVAYSPSTADVASLGSPASASLIGPLIDPHRHVLRYGSAIVIVLLVAGLRLALTPIMGTQAVLLPFVLAVLGAAIFGGFGPALLASVLAPILVTPFFAESIGMIDLAWSGHVALFIVIGGMVTVIMHRLQRSAWAQQAALAVTWQSQREASRIEAQLRLMADALPVLIAYVDANQRYRFNNNGYEEWFGIESGELHGRHMQAVWGNAAYEALRPHVDAALAGNRVECDLQLPYGSGIRDVRVHLMPDIGPSKAVGGLFAVIEDVSERKRAERAMLDKVSRLSLALRAGGAGTFEWDIDADVLVWSEENLELHGLRPGTFRRDREAWLDCVHADDRPSVLRALERSHVDGRFAIEYRVCRKDTGAIRWVHSCGQVISNEAGTNRLVGISADVSEPGRIER
jgi:PAS domain S-box-containing protein